MADNGDTIKRGGKRPANPPPTPQQSFVRTVEVVGRSAGKTQQLVDAAYKVGYEDGYREATEVARRSQLDWDELHG